VKQPVRLKEVINAPAQLLELDNTNKILFYEKDKNPIFWEKNQVFVSFS